MLNLEKSSNLFALREISISFFFLFFLQTSGWLNLLANVIDNFTHGLAVAGSYCVSTKVILFNLY